MTHQTDEPHRLMLLPPWRRDPRVKVMGDYLRERFRRNNHTKYHKYCDEWINNITIDQLGYFIEEKRRIDSGVVLK